MKVDAVILYGTTLNSVCAEFSLLNYSHQCPFQFPNSYISFEFFHDLIKRSEEEEGT